MQQYIGFNINSSEYMIPILTVREIISLPSITALPQLPPYVKGVTNLRGNIVPIVHLKRLLQSNGGSDTGKTVIVLTAGKIIFGIIVDGITGVMSVDASQIEPPDSFFNNNVESIVGVAKLNDKLRVFLDITKLIPLDDVALFEDAIIDVKDMGDGQNVEVTREVATIGGKVTVKELRDAKTFLSGTLNENGPVHDIFEMMVAFMDALSAKEYGKVQRIVEQLVKETDSDLFNEVGKITRKLHDSLEEFKGAFDNGLEKLTKDAVPNAIDKLQFVIAKTEDAANKTMGIVERYFEETDEYSKQLENIKGHEESVTYLKEFKESLDNDMTVILTAQQFQDITGQTIKKVIGLVRNVEVELLRLITKFGMPVKAETDKGAVGISGEKGGDDNEGNMVEKITQSDVEALLNDFGF